MSGEKSISVKRPRERLGSAFPENLEIPESALADRKFLTSYVNIFNDPRVYKRRRLNGDRTSSRFEVDYNYQINVVFNEPIVKRKSILTNTQSPKEKSQDDSGIRKSVSFLSKIIFIDSIDLDGGSSDWTDMELDESVEKSKKKSKSTPKEAKNGKNFKKLAAARNDIPSSKNHKQKKKDKSGNKNGSKSKSAPKELFKFKITKPFRKFGRSKEKKLKHLQKKFGRRMFKAFVHVKRSFNLKHIPDKVAVPLEKITLKTNDVLTPEKCVPSIQEFLIGQMTKPVKVSLTPVQDDTQDDTSEARISDTEIMQPDLTESEVQNSTNAANDVQSDRPVDRHRTKEKSETNIAENATPDCSEQTNQINGDLVPAGTIDSPEKEIVLCNDTEPSPELVESNPLPNVIDKITCNMYYNTHKDETVTLNGQMLETNNEEHMDLVDNISSLNVSFSMPTKSLTDNILGCDSSEIASIQL